MRNRFRVTLKLSKMDLVFCIYIAEMSSFCLCKKNKKGMIIFLIRKNPDIIHHSKGLHPVIFEGLKTNRLWLDLKRDHKHPVCVYRTS